MVISRGLLAVLYEKTVRRRPRRKVTAPPLPVLPDGLLPCSVSTGRFLLPGASMGQVWRNWGYFVVGQVSDVCFLYRVPVASLCLRPLLPPSGCFQTFAVSLSHAFLECDLATVSRLPTVGSCTIPLLALSSASSLWNPWTCPLDYQFKFLLCFLLVSFLHLSPDGHPRKLFLSSCRHTRTTVLRPSGKFSVILNSWIFWYPSILSQVLAILSVIALPSLVEHFIYLYYLYIANILLLCQN